MRKLSVQGVWLGSDHPWQAWVKRALFACLDVQEVDELPGEGIAAPPEPPPPWATEDMAWMGAGGAVALATDLPEAGPYRGGASRADESAVAFLIDLPGARSVATGLALGRRGFRPVLSINATSAVHEAIDMAEILALLVEGARSPGAFPAGSDVAPAFILDARREGGARPPAPGRFDNRWTVFPSDLPSAEALAGHGIRTVVVVQDGSEPRGDVQAIAWTYQRAGLDVRIANVGDRSIAVMPGPRGGWLRLAWRRLRRRFAFRREADGSYGHRVPIPPAPSHG